MVDKKKKNLIRFEMYSTTQNWFYSFLKTCTMCSGKLSKIITFFTIIKFRRTTKINFVKSIICSVLGHKMPMVFSVSWKISRLSIIRVRFTANIRDRVISKKFHKPRKKGK